MAAPAPTERPVTAREFANMRGHELYKMELVRGFVVRERRAPKPLHARLQNRMGYLLESWMVENKVRGAVMSGGGFVLATDPDTVRIPDIAYTAPDRIPDVGYGTTLWELGPDLVVEITSPSNTWTDIQERVNDFFSAGTRLVWVIDPATRTVTVYRPGGHAERLDAAAELEGEEVLPGFRAQLERFFDVLIAPQRG